MTKYYLEKYNAFDRTIIEEALLGVSYAEIARKYNLPYYNIPKIINSLKCPTSSNYNIALYSAIMMEQSLANIQIIDYDLQNSVTNYIKEGYSFLEIAILSDKTEEDVKNIFSSLKRNPETKEFIEESNFPIVGEAMVSSPNLTSGVLDGKVVVGNK